ncbi:MAG TPA: iduronate-2-sulfatase, partial [Planctomycetaceae bacterium]|nr:iduronate-2-sulfatase [Planctomycetaceae bacterium]
SPSMPAWFRQHGYRTVSVGKVSHHPGGRGGRNWDDDAQPEMPLSWDEHLCESGEWKHPRGVMHGLAHGEIREQASQMDVLQAIQGSDGIYPDGLTLQTAIEQLDTLSRGEKPFFLAVGFLKPHLPFGAPKKYLDLYEGVELPAIAHPNKPAGKTTWHRSGEFMKYNRWDRDPNADREFADLVRKHYAACVSYSDALVGKLLAALQKAGSSDDTVVVLWGDHGWHLGEHAIWGKHALFEESLHSPLIIRPANSGRQVVSQTVDAVVETIDVFPTVCKLADVEPPSGIDGENLFASVAQPPETSSATTGGNLAVSYTGKAQTIRSDQYRLIVHKDGSLELYDHAAEGETKNVASEFPSVVEQLRGQLDERLGRP